MKWLDNLFDRLPKKRRLLKPCFSIGQVKVYYVKPAFNEDVTKVSCSFPGQQYNPIYLPGDVPTVDDLMKEVARFPNNTVLVCDEREIDE